MTEMQSRLIEEYIELMGESPDPSINALLMQMTDDSRVYGWELLESGIPQLVVIDPFGEGFSLPEKNTNFGPESKVDPKDYEDSPFDMADSKQGDVVKNLPMAVTHLRALKEILPEKERNQLMTNHDSGNAESTRQVLEGFGIDRLIECYAEGMKDEVVCSYLNIRPAQLKRWIASSPQRMVMIQRLRDIMRSEKVRGIIDETFDYEIGQVFDKASASYESLRLNAAKMKGSTAMELEARARMKEQGDTSSLPVVNIGFQLNLDGSKGEQIDKAVPVIPSIVVAQD